MHRIRFYLLSFCLTISLNSQTIYDKPLSEEIIKRIMPVLSAEAETKKGNNNYSPDNDFGNILNNIENGTVDPYLFIKSKSGYADVPDGAIYDEAASKYLTHQLTTPAAVFTFGIDASEYSKEIYFADKKPDSTFLETLRTRSDHKKVSYLLNSASKFYNDHKFDEITEYYSPDNSIKVQLNEASYYHFLNYTNISTGPLILLMLTNPHNPRELDNVKFEKALKESGFSLVEYQNIKNILIQALMDSKDLNIFRTDSKKPSNQAEQKAYEEEQKMLNIRKMNAYLYNNHAEELNLIFKEFSLITE